MLVNQLWIIPGAAGLLSCFGCLIALHILPTGYQPLRDPVSNYAVSRYGFLYRIQAFSSGFCGVCLLGWFAMSGITLPTLGIIALLIYSLSRMLIIFFPTDVQPPRTLTGTIHILLAILTFTGIAVAAGILTPPLTGLAIGSKLVWGLRAAALLTEVAAIAFVFVFALRPLHPIVGLVERCIYVGTILWMALVLWQLILRV